MKESTLKFSEIGMIAATRGMLGAGAGLLVASGMSEQKRKSIGWKLLAVGTLSTIPLVIDVMRKSHDCKN